MTTHNREIHRKPRSRSKQLLRQHAWWPKSIDQIPGPTVKQQREKDRSVAIFTDSISLFICPISDFSLGDGVAYRNFKPCFMASMYMNIYIHIYVCLRFCWCLRTTCLKPRPSLSLSLSLSLSPYRLPEFVLI